jgi:serine/threonine protein kinase
LVSEYSLEETGGPEPAKERHFGRYRLAYQLASGGMGSVFLARADGPGGFEKLVALKRIHAHLASDRRFVSMFLDEARIAARIQHPNVCGVIDFGEVDGAYFLTMPFIVGESMNRVIGTVAKMSSGPLYDLMPLIAARLVADACEGLHAAHELKDDAGHLLDVVHRDVSPQNLMVGYDGVVRVLDFGVASARHRHYQTTTGEVKGKFAYLSPEQIDSGPVDRRSDVWALGVCLWEAVTARRLFARETMPKTIKAVCEMPIPALRSVRPDAPEALEPIVERALARDVERRYPNARALGRDLAAVIAKSDRFVGAPEVAEWLEQLLPGSMREQERLADETRLGTIDSTRQLPEQAVETSSVMLKTPERAARSSPRRTLALVAVVGVIFGLTIVIGAGVGWWAMSDGDPPQMTARELPRTSAPRTRVVDPPPVVAPEVEPPARVAVAEPPPVEAPSPVAEPIAEPVPVAEPAPVAEPVVEARRGPGTLTIATPGGWGIAYLGGRQLGEVPGVFRVPGGEQTIQIAPFGQGPRIRRRVNVPEGGTANLSVPLRR